MTDSNSVTYNFQLPPRKPLFRDCSMNISSTNYLVAVNIPQVSDALNTLVPDISNGTPRKLVLSRNIAKTS